MKKLMFLVPAAALALASCSSDESISKSSLDGNALTMRPVMQNTRTVSFVNTNFKEFKLDVQGEFVDAATNGNAYTADKLLGMTVQKQDDETWKITEPAGSYYWKGKNTQGTFTAYAPVEITPGNYTVSRTNSEQKDIVVAYNQGCYNDFQNGVPLHFRHVLSSIQVKADNKNDVGDNAIIIKVRNMKLCRINSVNTLTLPTTSTATGFSWDTYKPWLNDANTAVTFSGTQAETPITLSSGTAQDITFGDPFLMLPQQLAGVNSLETGAYLAVEIQANGKNAKGESVQYPTVSGTAEQGYAWAAIPLTTLWKPGYKYIYTLHFSNNGIGKNGDPESDNFGDDIIDGPVLLTFDVQVIDWEEATPEERTM